MGLSENIRYFFFGDRRKGTAEIKIYFIRNFVKILGTNATYILYTSYGWYQITLNTWKTLNMY